MTVADVPHDGKITIPNTEESAAHWLNRLKVKAVNEDGAGIADGVNKAILKRYKEVTGYMTTENGENDSSETTKKASELSETDLRTLLDGVINGELDKRSYVPLRRNTPQFFIDVVREHSGGKINILNVPMASTVEHLTQNMEEYDGADYGNEEPHGLSADDIVTISKEMGNPKYIVLQENGRYAEIVSFFSEKRNKQVVVSIDIADNAESKKNYKYSEYMNGYNDGYYNIIVTEYEPSSLKHYLENNEIVYDKKTMNGKYQVGSGRIVTFTHDNPFIDSDSTTLSPESQEEDAKFSYADEEKDAENISASGKISVGMSDAERESVLRNITVDVSEYDREVDDVISENRDTLNSNENNHGWLDKNGWLHRSANVINAKNGAVYNITLDIAKSDDGRVILYATKGNIKRVGNADVNSLKIRGTGQSSNSLYNDNTTLSPESQEEDAKFSYADEEKDAENISASDVRSLREVAEAHGGKRVSINDFTSEDIRKSEKWARKFYRELGMKSPFFRAWFGDWRAYDTTKLQFVSVNDEKIIASDVSRTGTLNYDTGWNISVNRNGIDETANKNGVWSDAYHSLKSINDMLKKAILIDTVVVSNPSKRLGEQVAFIHNMYCPVISSGHKAIAKLYVTEEIGDVHHFYLTKTEMVSPDSRVLSNKAVAPNSSDDTAISIAELYEFVNVLDEKFEYGSKESTEFSPKPVNPLMLNEDGTPKVFYHRTNADFTVFDKSKTGSKTDNGIYGAGFYFSSSKGNTEKQESISLM